MAGTLYTYGANATGTASFFQGFDKIAYSPLDDTSAVMLRLSEAGTVDLTTQLAGRGVTFTAAATGANFITTSDGDDTIIGGLDGDTLNGGAGNDTIYSSASGTDDNASDTLIGGSGNDTLVDYGGPSTNLSGGSGNDVFRIGRLSAGAAPMTGTIDGGDDIDRIEAVASGSGGYLSPLNLQNLTISNVEILDAGAGVIATATQFAGFQSIVNASNKTLTLAAPGSVDFGTRLGNQTYVTIAGSSGNDEIAATGNFLTINGGEGNDTLSVLGNYGTLNGGGGVDTISYAGSDKGVTIDLVGGVVVRAGDYSSSATFSSIENATGSGFDDRFIASAGANAFNGGAGTDIVSYERSNASVTINLLTGSISGGFATGDTFTSIEGVTGSTFADVITGDNGDNVLDGGGGADLVHGGEGNDTIYVGGFAPDNPLVYGDGGNDTIYFSPYSLGYEGNATAYGGEGNDTFLVIDRAYGTIDGGTGSDSLYLSVDDNKDAHGLARLNIVDIEHLYISTMGPSAMFTAAQLASFQTIASTDPGQMVWLRIRSDPGVSLDLSAQLQGQSANVTVDNLAFFRSSNGNDVIRLNAQAAATLDGGAGDDSLYGNDLANSLTGGIGADRIDGAGGIDTASYAGSALGVTVNLATGVGTGGDAQGDRLYNIENLVGSSKADNLTGSSIANRIEGGAGADRLDGAKGDDTLIGGAGADALIGGAGIDTADYSASSAAVRVSLNLNTATGGDAEGDSFNGIENFIGSAFADILTGNDGANRLQGGDGDDVLTGRAGGDALIGGSGSDTASYAYSAAAVNVNLTTGSASGGDAAGDTFSSIENFIGSSFADTLVGNAGVNRLEGADGADTLIGRGGADALIGGTGTDTASYAGGTVAVRADLSTGTGTGGDAQGDTYSSIENVIGTDLADVLIGSSAANRLDGGKGDDTLSGRGGADALVGGDGVDLVTYGTSAAAVRVDLINGVGTGGDAQGDTYSGIENIKGSDFADTLIGNSAANVIDGSNGDDILAGRGGADQLIGGSGSDTASYGTSLAGVSVNLATGAASGGDAQGDTFSSIENLTGSTLADTLIGSSGANRLNGGLGNDTLTGGGGADTFQFTTAPGSGNVDTITDMTVGSDLISLATSIYSALQAGATPGSLAASSFRYSTQASTSGGLGEIIYNATTGSLSYDADGSGAGAAKQFAQVSSSLALSASSFRLA